VIAGRYQVDGELGRGGMAEVRAGTDLRLQRPVAVKFLLPEMAAREDIRRRFEAEARSAASLGHPHAVAVFDTGEHDGQPYIVMERLPGETLADRIAAGPVDPEWLRTVIGEVLGALAAAHAAGLVHRDVKPGNILITADGHAKIADFGIAKSLEGARGFGEGGGTSDLTVAGQLIGTPAYLAPERIDGAPATARADIYAMGVVLYEALAGRNPFPGDTPLAAFRAVIEGRYPPLAEVRPGLDPALLAVVDRAMAPDPDRRFPSAAAMAAALAGQPAAATPTLVDGAMAPAGGTAVLPPSGVAPTLVGGRTEVVGAPAPPTTDAAVPAALRRPRGRVPLALIVVVAFVALLVAGLQGRSHPAATSSGVDSAANQPSTTAAPATTAAGPATAAGQAADLRAAADRLTAADGVRAGDLAIRLRQVADLVSSGSPGAGVAATETLVAVGTWRLAGQLSDAATVTAATLLGRVPGVSTAPTQPATTAAPARTTPTPAPAAPGNSGGKGKDKGKND
jgi:serine/threonine-protein kinase